MGNIEPSASNQLGGLCRFEFAPLEDVASIMYPLNHVIDTDVTFEPGKGWFTAYTAPDSLQFEERMRKGKGGKHYAVRVSGFVPQDFDIRAGLMAEMDNRPFIVKVLDNNAQMRLVGTLEQPLHFSSILRSGRSASVRIGYQIEFSGEMNRRSPFYTGN